MTDVKTPVQQAPNQNQQNSQVAKKEPNVVESTLMRISEMQSTGGLRIPKDFSAENALRSAWLILQDVKDLNKRPVLEVCDKSSIANALLNMVVQGLNPMKRQCSFIAYGSKLTLQREYQGSIALAKRYGLKSVIANPIYKGDEFQFEVDPETGRKKIKAHVPSLDSFGGEIRGAYAIIEMEDGTKNVEIMTMEQIRKAWEQGATKGQSLAHKNFPDQMSCKTVINRAVKTIINSSDDAALFEDDEPTETVHTAAVKHEIKTNANGAGGGREIGFEETDIQHTEVITEKPSAEPEQEVKSTPQDQSQKAPF